jgi:hypothetical protein
MRHLKPIALAALMLAACGKEEVDEFAEATPDMEGVQLELSGNEEGLAGLRFNAVGESDAALSTPPEYLQKVREGIRDLNEGLRRALAPVAELIRAGDPLEQREVRIYGPRDIDGATFRLVVRRGMLRRFGWVLQAKKIGADDASYVNVMAGHMIRGLRAHRGRGVLGIDLDAYKTVVESYPGQGKLFVAYHHIGEHKALLYALNGFTPNVATHEPVDAVFAGHRIMPSGATRVRTASMTDLVEGAAGRELVLSRARWVPGEGGRAAIFVPALRNGLPNGDMPADRYRVAVSCWDGNEAEVFKRAVECDDTVLPTDPSCTVLISEGDAAACKLEELPEPRNPASTDLEEGNPGPTDLPPGAMPDGT